MNRSLLVLAIAPVVALYLQACGGSPPPEPAHPGHMDEHGEHGEHGEHHGGGHHGHGMMEGHDHDEHGEHGEHDEHKEEAHMKPELKAFHQVLAPVWHSQPGDVRIAKACDNAAAFRDKAAATGDAALVDGAAQLATACSSRGPAVETALTKLHERFHALAEAH